MLEKKDNSIINLALFAIVAASQSLAVPFIAHPGLAQTPDVLAAESVSGDGVAAASISAAPITTASPTSSASPDEVTSSALAASPNADASATATDAKSAQMEGILPWLWLLLPLGLLGLLFWWLKNRRDTPDESAERQIEPIAPPSEPTAVPPATDLANPPAENSNLASRAESVINSDRASIAEQPSPEISDTTLEATAPNSPVPNLIGDATIASGATDWTDRSQDTAPETSLDILSTSQEEATSEDLEIEAALSTLDTIDELDSDLSNEITDDPTELDLDEATSASGLAGVVSPIVAAGLVGGVAAWALSDDDRAQSEVEAAKFDVGQTDLSSETLATVDEGLPDLPEGYGESRIVLLPRDPQWGYTYWDVSNEHKSEVRQQGGQNLVLRLYDVTDIEVNHQTPHSMQQFNCDEMARDWYLSIPVSDRDYLVEIGYLTRAGQWLMLARSTPVRIPPAYPSDWSEEQFVTIDWQEDLRGKTFLELVPPGEQTEAVTNPIYDRLSELAQSAEAERVVGSLFGSIQQVSQQAISSFVLQPGVGIGALPTHSGIGMSGIGMSGVGMSGVGFAASAPAIRPRNFWLVADAELIVYGATEPDAKVTIDGNPIKLNPDGTFRFQLSFQDGVIRYPIVAVAADGEQMRSIHMKFTRETLDRNTNTKNEAQNEWLF